MLKWQLCLMQKMFNHKTEKDKIMKEFIVTGGPFMYPLIIIIFANVILAILSGIQLYLKNNWQSVQHRVNAILFWGCIALVTGFLGQFSGIYLAVNIIMNATEISPPIVLMGFAQTFTTSISGMWILTVSAIMWFILRGRIFHLQQESSK